jgi:hypothetical protein
MLNYKNKIITLPFNILVFIDPNKLTGYTIIMTNKKLIIKIISGVIIIFAIMTFIFTKSQTNIVYTNTTYGFNVTLPKSWTGYSVTVDKWTGDAINDQLGNVPYTSGPVVSIHNPKWTGANTYQDIPIMVFTLVQWGDLLAEKLHIGAAPIGPSELGRNTKYVFALPARYNYAFPHGYEEVDQIIRSKPLTTF